MKKFLTCLTAFLTIYVGFDAQVSSAASAGGRCSKAGKTEIVGTARLVCVAVGNSKTWVALDSAAFKAPVITSVVIAPTATQTYYLQGQIIVVLVTFDSGVVVTGVPQLGLDSEMKSRFLYSGGSGSQVLMFTYATKSTDVDSIGMGVLADSIELSGGTIKSLNGTPANLSHAAIARSSTRKLGATAPVVTATTVATTTTVASTATTTTTTTTVSSGAPKITSIAFKEPGSKWVTGQNVVFKVTFDKAVVVNTASGTPYISVLSDSTQKLTANGVFYTEGSGGTILLFSYTVISADTESTGLGINANAIVLNGGTIKTAAGVSADLTHAAIARSSTRKIN